MVGLKDEGSAVGKIKAEQAAWGAGNPISEGDMFLIRRQPAVTAVWEGITVENHFIFPLRSFKAIVAVGMHGVEVKGKHQPGPFKDDDLVVVMFI